MSVIVYALIAALAVSAIGFRKYVWFISIGYGFAISAIGLLMLAVFKGSIDRGLIIASVLLIIYGVRLGGYLVYREFRIGSYNKKMEGEIKDGKSMPVIAKIAIWISAAVLYVCETSPILFRLENALKSDGWMIAGEVIMVLGLIIETAADLQKNAAKKVNPRRFVDKGLFRIVRCPNYFGEMTFWTGVFVTGISSNTGAFQWITALLGYIGIIYVMFGGARRLEMRQNRTYGDDPEYIEYVKKTPIMIPLVPLYSVEKYKWLVA